MMKNNYVKIGLVYTFVYLITSFINMFNGYSFGQFWFATLLSSVVYVTIALIGLYVFKKLNIFLKIPLVYLITFIVTILLNVIQGYPYDMYIKSVVFGMIITGTMSIGLIYMFGVKFDK